MNTGLVDAVVLGQALTAVICDNASVLILDEYAEVRRRAAAQVLPLTSRLTRIATVGPFLLRKLRNLVLRLLNRMPAFKAKAALQLSGLSRRDLASLSVSTEENRFPIAFSREVLRDAA